MLNVTVFLDTDNNVASFEAKGHTKTAPHGQDVACAGASALIQAAVMGCRRLLNVTAGIEQEDGFIYFSLPSNLPDDIIEKAQVILKTMLLGLEQIELQYPDNIKINKTRNPGDYH